MATPQISSKFTSSPYIHTQPNYLSNIWTHKAVTGLVNNQPNDRGNTSSLNAFDTKPVYPKYRLPWWYSVPADLEAIYYTSLVQPPRKIAHLSVRNLIPKACTAGDINTQAIAI